MGPAALCWPTSVRRVRRLRRAAHHGGLGPGRACGSHRWPTRWKGPSSSPGPPCKWLRDGLGLIEESKDIGPLAAQGSVERRRLRRPGLHGLGSRGGIPTRGDRQRSHPRCRAAGRSPGLWSSHGPSRCATFVDTMGADGPTRLALRVDGGASVMDLPAAAPGRPGPGTGREAGDDGDDGPRSGLVGGLPKGCGVSLADLSALWTLERNLHADGVGRRRRSAHAGWLGPSSGRSAGHSTAGTGLPARLPVGVRRCRSGRSSWPVGHGVRHQVRGQAGHHLNDLIVLLRRPAAGSSSSPSRRGRARDGRARPGPSRSTEETRWVGIGPGRRSSSSRIRASSSPSRVTAAPGHGDARPTERPSGPQTSMRSSNQQPAGDTSRAGLRWPASG